jgi:hypothetical protein
MKKPVLMIGIIMFLLFLYQVASKEKWGIFANSKLIPTSCRCVLVGLERRIPENWKVFCEGNNLAVEIKELAIPEDVENIKPLLYRQLANHMAFLARNSANDILEKVFFVRFHLVHDKMTIDAVTEGKFIVKLSTLENSKHIMTHLKSTVQVKETVK